MKHFGPTTPSEFYDASDVWSHEEIVVDDLGRKYELTDDGSVSLGEVSRKVLLQQDQYGGHYVTGAYGEYPDFGSDLDFVDDNGKKPTSRTEYYVIGVLAEDIPAFVGRVTAYQALAWGSLIDGETRRYPTDEEKVEAAEYLIEQGFGELFKD